MREAWTPERRAAARARALARMQSSYEEEKEVVFEGPGGVCRVVEQSESGEIRKLVVSRVPINPRIVECEGGDGEGVLLVDVGRNGTLVAGDEIEVVRLEGAGVEYRFVRMANEGLRVDRIGLPMDRRRWEVRR